MCQHKFLGNEDSFWKSHSNISKMISEVIGVQNAESTVLWNSTNDFDAFERNYFPGDDGRAIDFCHKFQVSNLYKFRQLQLIVTDDVFFYIHLKGQLIENTLSSRRDALSIKKTNTADGVYIFGKIYDLGLSFIDLRYDAMDCALVEENYDKCIQR